MFPTEPPGCRGQSAHRPRAAGGGQLPLRAPAPECPTGGTTSELPIRAAGASSPPPGAGRLARQRFANDIRPLEAAAELVDGPQARALTPLNEALGSGRSGKVAARSDREATASPDGGAQRGGDDTPCA